MIPGRAARATGARRAPTIRHGRGGEEPLPQRRAALRQRAWKVKLQGGMVYDFGDSDSARSWLESRPTHEGLTLSDDEGATWRTLPEIDDMCDLRPKGLQPGRRTASQPRVTSSSAPAAVRTATPAGGQRKSSFTGAHEVAAIRADRGDTGNAKAVGSGASKASKKDAKKSGAGRKTLPKSGASKPVRPPKSTGAVRSAELGRKKGESDGPGLGRLVGLVLVMVVAIGGAAYYFTSATQPEEIPATPAGTQVTWVLQQMNGGAATLTPQQVQQHFSATALTQTPADDLISGLRYYDERAPGYDFQRVVSKQGETRVAIGVMTAIGLTATIEVEVEPTPPHKITNLQFHIDE